MPLPRPQPHRCLARIPCLAYCPLVSCGSIEPPGTAAREGANRPGDSGRRHDGLHGAGATSGVPRARHVQSESGRRCSARPRWGVIGEGATQPPGPGTRRGRRHPCRRCRRARPTLYVTLEPCAHFGRTAPCADAILAAGVAEAHVAMIDPSPWVRWPGVGPPWSRRGSGSGGSSTSRRHAAPERGVPELAAARPSVGDGRLRPRPRRQPRSLADAALGEKTLAEIDRLRARADRTVASADALLADDPRL